MEKRLDELSGYLLNQNWLTKTIAEYHQIQGRLFRLEQIYNKPQSQ